MAKCTILYMGKEDRYLSDGILVINFEKALLALEEDLIKSETFFAPTLL
ncbi:hypothetical protein [Caedibacter taeniospiralis]|nr:hypothetical protein [Caedibacter taeniospiralis]